MHGKFNESRTSAPAGAARIVVWLGMPEAARHFDPAALQPAERDRFATMRRPRRCEEFKVSRALRAHVRGPGSAAESLSHSAGYAAIAQAPADFLVGIDLEVHRSRDLLAIAHAMFSAREAAVLEAMGSTQRRRIFYALWTMKEALAKALQLNLVDALRRCEFVPGEGTWRGLVPTQSSGFVTVFEPRPDMSLAVAYAGGRDCLPIRTVNWPPQHEACWPVIAVGAFFPSAARAAVATAP